MLSQFNKQTFKNLNYNNKNHCLQHIFNTLTICTSSSQETIQVNFAWNQLILSQRAQWCCSKSNCSRMSKLVVQIPHKLRVLYFQVHQYKTGNATIKWECMIFFHYSSSLSNAPETTQKCPNTWTGTQAYILKK